MRDHSHITDPNTYIALIQHGRTQERVVFRLSFLYWITQNTLDKQQVQAGGKGTFTPTEPRYPLHRSSKKPDFFMSDKNALKHYISMNEVCQNDH